jgi:DNA-directed RNA polymerase subunit RPC12/RpoP
MIKITITNASIEISHDTDEKNDQLIESLKAIVSDLEIACIMKDKEIEKLNNLCAQPLESSTPQSVAEAPEATEAATSPTQVAEAIEATEAATSPTQVAEAIEATTAATTKKEIACICKVCGKAFDASHNRAQFCSDECRSANKIQKQSADHVTIKTKKCIECGSEFQPTSNRQVRCEACGIKKKSRKRNSAPTKAQKN